MDGHQEQQSNHCVPSESFWATSFCIVYNFSWHINYIQVPITGWAKREGYEGEEIEKEKDTPKGGGRPKSPK